MSGFRAEKATLVGGALAAFGASVCCLGPLVLVAIGVSGAWIGSLAALEAYRPIFIGAAVVMLAFAWRRIYRTRVAAACSPDGPCALPRANGIYRAMFWIVSALVLLALVFPYIVPYFY